MHFTFEKVNVEEASYLLPPELYFRNSLLLFIVISLFTVILCLSDSTRISLLYPNSYTQPVGQGGTFFIHISSLGASESLCAIVGPGSVQPIERDGLQL